MDPEENPEVIHLSRISPFKRFLKFFGPAIMVSIAYLDPGNRFSIFYLVAGDIEAGVSGKYSLLWVLFLSTFMGFWFQILAARIGTVTGQDMATLCRKGYPKATSMFLWIMAEIAIICADIQEVVGSAIALYILFGLPLYLGVIITVVDTFILLFLQYFGMHKIEHIFSVFIVAMATCFFVNLFMVGPDWVELLKGLFIPSIPEGSWNACVGLIGSLLMPHNIYLHSALVLTRSFNRKNENSVQRALNFFHIEAAITLFMSFVINLTVISTFAYWNGKKDDLNPMQAGDALELTFSSAGKYIWAFGLLASGQSSTLAGTMTGQFIMQGFLDLKINRVLRSVMTRSLAIGPALFMVFFKNVVDINEQLNIMQAIQLPFAIIPLLTIGTNSNAMGKFKCSKLLFYVLLVTAIGLVSMNIKNSAPDAGFTLFNSDFISTSMFVYIIILIVYLGAILILSMQKFIFVDRSESAKELFKTVDVDFVIAFK